MFLDIYRIMRRVKDKLIVIITSSVAIMFMSIAFWVNLLVPKDIDIKDGLIFGNEKAKVTVVIFEDFKCKYCKTFFNETFPKIKEKYIDTAKIRYVIIPLSFVYGSKQVANAAIAVYELKKDQFFEFIKNISTKKAKFLTKRDLIEIATNLKGINLEIFEEFLDKKVFNNYLEQNMILAQKIMSTLEIPTVYINGHKVDIDKIENIIDESLNYKAYE